MQNSKRVDALIPASIDRALFDNTLYEQMRHLQPHLPPFWAGIQVYELHLSAPGRRVDLSTLVRNIPEDHQAFCQWVKSTKPYYPPESYQALQSLSEALVSEPEAFAALHFLWLEFDLPAAGSALPVPGLVAGFQPGLAIDTIQQTILQLARHLPLSEAAIREPLRDTLHEWKGATSACSFSYMLSRQPGNAFRLLLGAEDDDLSRFLAAMPRGEMARNFRSLAKELAGCPGYLRLELNLNEQGILPARALHQFAHLHPHHAKEAFQFIDKAGLCTPENRRIFNNIIPANSSVEGLLAPPVHLLASKVLYHGEDTSLTGKAYFRHLPLPL